MTDKVPKYTDGKMASTRWVETTQEDSESHVSLGEGGWQSSLKDGEYHKMMEVTSLLERCRHKEVEAWRVTPHIGHKVHFP